VKIKATPGCPICEGTGISQSERATVRVHRGDEAVGWLCPCARVHAASRHVMPPAEADCATPGCGDTPTSRWTGRNGAILYSCPEHFITLVQATGIAH
jgi:hypothetical protein